MKRLLPHPLLSATVFVLWLLLVQSLAPASLLMAAILALAAPPLTESLRPAPAVLRHPGVVLRLLLRVARDSAASNLHTARLLATRRARDIPSDFVRVPLTTRNANALAVLAVIVCATPGTAWAELAADGSVLLLHVFDASEPETLVHHIHTHYEQPLLEIFG